jgi:hypothetical protein
MSCYRSIGVWLCVAAGGLAGALMGCGRRAGDAAPATETGGAASPSQPAQRPEPAPTRAKAPEPTTKTGGAATSDIRAEFAETQKQLDRVIAEKHQQPAAPPTPGATAEADAAKHPEPAPAPPAKPEPTVVVGKIIVASSVPDPSTVPYKDCVTFVKYHVESVESGHYDGEELLAVLWGMRDGKLQPAARFAVGDRHRLTIELFAEREDLARVMQADDTNEYSLPPYWVIRYTGA